MDYARAFTFARDDKEWISKLLIGILMSILSAFILPAFILLGYQLEITRNVMNGDDKRLPAWDDYGRYLSEGFKLAVAQLVYALPIFAVMLLIIPAAVASENGAEGIATLFALAVGCIAVVIGILIAFLQPAVVIQYARTGELSEVFRFSEVWRLTRENLAEILMTFLVSIAAALALGIVVPLSIITCVGPLVLGLAGPLWLTAGQYHLYGQIGARSDGAINKFKDFGPDFDLT